MTQDFLFRGSLAEVDPIVAELVRHETARQARYLVMIPSESTIPQAVREAVGSAFHNIYAEGYPLDETRWMNEADILDYDRQMANYRRNGDNRYYKGTEYANIIEALARRRVAEAFANERVSADQLYVNVQPLSGAPANSAAYSALLEVGDTVMGLDLLHGGHLTHGSPVNRSGIYYNIVSYGVDQKTERLDYNQIMDLALETRPKMIIAGFTSYPFAPDFETFREIADAVGAYLLADIAHTAGMAIAGAYPNPVGLADVVNFTTHKTLGGPRGAVSITHRSDLYKKIDRAVFPGEQGGPHMNSVAGLAVAMTFAKTEQFHKLQHQTKANAVTLAERLKARGLRVVHDGTDTHMLLVDCKSITGPDGTPLSGDMAARVIDLVGIAANRNTIPGDASAFRSSGMRFGTAWITQRGFFEAETIELADIIADVFHACMPFSYPGRRRPLQRTKVDFDVLQNARDRVRDLTARIGIDTDAVADDYPHFFYMEADVDDAGWQSLSIEGTDAATFLDYAVTGQVFGLGPGEQAAANLLNPDGTVLTRAVVEATGTGYCLHVEQNAQHALAWLRSLSDGFVLFDHADLLAKLPGPVIVKHVGDVDASSLKVDENDSGYAPKPYCIGINGEQYAGPQGEALAAFEWVEAEAQDLLQTPLHALHLELGAKMAPFAGYDMPLWYSSVSAEHSAVRDGAGLFDVAHMGVFEATGPDALAFLNAVTTNDLTKLAVGSSMYGFLLDANGEPLDDLLVYRMGEDNFILVVNASNNDKNWTWLNAVKNGDVIIDPARPWAKLSANFTLRDLRNAGSDSRIDIAVQGPKSKDIVLALGGDEAHLAVVSGLKWAEQAPVTLGGYDLIVSRTGYTGERVAYELFVHPGKAEALFKQLVDLGATPCGLASRDSLRTEAGLPLYGQELAGPLSLNPADAGMGNFVKLWKPFFIGRSAFLAHEAERDAEVVRFRIDTRGARPPHAGDAVVDKRGRVVGKVTSCAVDSEGYQLGQAYIKQSLAEEGSTVGVLTGTVKAPNNDLNIGDRLTVPQMATVLSRFPKKRKK